MTGSDPSTGERTLVSRRGVLAAGGTALALNGSAVAGATTSDDRPDCDRTDESSDDSDNADDDPEPDGPSPWRRGLYVHPRWAWHDAPRPERAIRDWLDRVERAGVTTVYAWAESPELAAVLGEPRYAAAYDFWAGDPDPLAVLVREAHDRDIAVHLWYSLTRYKRRREWTPEYDPDLSVLPAGDPAWASVRKSEWTDGVRDPADAAGDALCSNAFESHEWTVAVLDRLFDRYALDGLHVEEPGYMALDRCVCPRCRAAYADRYDEPGDRLVEHVYDRLEPYAHDDRAVEVKVRGTDRAVRRLHDWWDGRADVAHLSYNGSWSASWGRARGRNWAAWSEDGLLPAYHPQTYTDSVDEFRDQVNACLNAVDGDTDVAPIVGIDWSRGENTPERVRRQLHAVSAVPRDPIAGAGLFAGDTLTDGMTAMLAAEGPLRAED